MSEQVANFLAMRGMGAVICEGKQIAEVCDTIESLAAEVAMLREAINNGCLCIAQYGEQPPEVLLQALSLPTNHAAILAQRDARTLRDAAEKLETTPCMSGLDCAIELSHMAAELEASQGEKK